MSRLKRAAAELARSARSRATVTGYAADWRDFVAWCAAAGRAARGASDETVSLFAAHLLEHRALSTVRRKLAAVAAHGVVIGEQTRAVMSGAARLAPPPKAKAAISLADLRAMLKTCGRDRAGLRDRAVLLLGFASGCRRAELAALDVSDVTFDRRGLRLRIRRSKTDQTGQGREVGIHWGKSAATCPVKAVRAWLDVRSRVDGPLFVAVDRYGHLRGRRLPVRTFYDIVKARAAAAGLDASRYGAHSLRAGCVTAAAEAGESHFAVMSRTGHRSVQTVARYFRPTDAFASNPLRRVL